ncbi:MAG: discoidin domain-containing protein [Pedobacter sp.]|nr:MAG: discoidin domain-containing protein [Pedobacter sp.]
MFFEEKSILLLSVKFFNYEILIKDELERLGAKVDSIIPFSEEYINKGARTLTDGSRGYLDYDYNWLGWYGDDMEVVIDLGKIIKINSVNASFLEDQRHWAFPPAMVNYSFSLDGENFSGSHELKSKHDLYEEYIKSVVDYPYNLAEPIKARYVKVKAKNLKQLPQWRYYKNKKAWLFADEIMIK